MPEKKEKNIYQKLMESRVALHEMSIKPTGKNKFAGYEYFELSDFVPQTTRIFNDKGLAAFISFGNDFATMTIIDVDDPEQKIVLTSPMATAELKGCHPIQNLGAAETYERRYLYMAAMEMTEPDAADSTEPIPQKSASQSNQSIPPKETKPANGKATAEQVNEIARLLMKQAVETKDITTLLSLHLARGIKGSSDLSYGEAANCLIAFKSSKKVHELKSQLGIEPPPEEKPQEPPVPVGAPEDAELPEDDLPF